jgi:hypothetical protein
MTKQGVLGGRRRSVLRDDSLTWAAAVCLRHARSCRSVKDEVLRRAGELGPQLEEQHARLAAILDGIAAEVGLGC